MPACQEGEESPPLDGKSAGTFADAMLRLEQDEGL